MKIHPLKKKWFLDVFFRFILKISWEILSRKKSYWWDWTFYEGEIESFIKVDKDENAGSTRGLLGNFFQRNFFWQKVFIFSAGEGKDHYQIGFKNGNHKEICSLVMSPGETVGLLVGDEDVNFFAVSFPWKINIPLHLIGETKRYIAKIPII